MNIVSSPSPSTTLAPQAIPSTTASIEAITLIGAGTIGLSFCALHLSASTTGNNTITIFDPRPDLQRYIHMKLPQYLPPDSPSVATLFASRRLVVARTLEDACTLSTDLVQEQGPECDVFKSLLWPNIETMVSGKCHLWSSSLAIPASVQARNMRQPSRLLVVHPFNPPHFMPLVEIVPSQDTPPDLISAATEYFEACNHSLTVLQREKKGFVANRLAFVLLREACSLVVEKVVTVLEIDAIVENSIGLRWAVRGPFRSWHDCGGPDGFRGFWENAGKAIQEVWQESGGGNEGVSFGAPRGEKGAWIEEVCMQTEVAYGKVNDEELAERDRITRAVLEAIKREKEEIRREKRERMRTRS